MAPGGLSRGYARAVEPGRPARRPMSVRRALVISIVATLALLALAGLALAGTLRVPASPAPNPPTASDLPAPGVPSDRKLVPAPIDELDVLIRESMPPQVSVRVMAGLPSGCAQRHSHKVERAGSVITITVLNSMPTGEVMCTMIYGTYELMIDLGTDFAPGTYTIRVNDKEQTFKV